MISTLLSCTAASTLRESIKSSTVNEHFLFIFAFNYNLLAYFFIMKVFIILFRTTMILTSHHQKLLHPHIQLLPTPIPPTVSQPLHLINTETVMLVHLLLNTKDNLQALLMNLSVRQALLAVRYNTLFMCSVSFFLSSFFSLSSLYSLLLFISFSFLFRSWICVNIIYQDKAPSTPRETIPIDISVTDPEKFGDGMNSYITYKIKTSVSRKCQCLEHI